MKNNTNLVIFLVIGVLIGLFVLGTISSGVSNNQTSNTLDSKNTLDYESDDSKLSNKVSDSESKGDAKPFWTDSEYLQVCKVPYYTSEGCNELEVTLVNETTARIHLSNGGYKVTNKLTCYKGSVAGQEPKYVFCRSWDSDNQQWDILPTWIKL